MDFRKALRKLVLNVDKYNSLTLVKTPNSTGFKTFFPLSWKLGKPQTSFKNAVTQGHYISHCTCDV